MSALKNYIEFLFRKWQKRTLAKYVWYEANMRLTDFFMDETVALPGFFAHAFILLNGRYFSFI